MAATVYSIIDNGAEGIKTSIECHLSKGLPALVIVGLGNKAVDEAKERIRSAFVNIGLELPRKRITINLAPGDVPKEGTGFDVAIAVAILVASQRCQQTPSPKEVFIGELGLDGSVRPVRGIIGKLLAARRYGAERAFIPAGNLNQALLVPNLELIPVNSLKDLYVHFSGSLLLYPLSHSRRKLGRLQATPSYGHDFADVVGQTRAKRALEIAAAGGHNVLLSGPPGSGKSMLAKALPSILPPLTREECLEVTHLHSLSNTAYEQIVTERPFRSPHHSASTISIVGGGQNPRPGEISLSHRGVLFLDEFPEFVRSAIEALRQPLEDGVITVARAKGSVTYPADFILVATSNPCPCGYYGSQKPCSCLPQQIVKYQRKISGPVLDRIDMYVEVDEVVHEKLLTKSEAEPSRIILGRTLQARSVQRRRYGNPSKTNAQLTNKDIKHFSQPSPEAKELLDKAAATLTISARSYMRILKVARTIADLANSPVVGIEHISEALQYRYQPVEL